MGLVQRFETYSVVRTTNFSHTSENRECIGDTMRLYLPVQRVQLLLFAPSPHNFNSILRLQYLPADTMMTPSSRARAVITPILIEKQDEDALRYGGSGSDSNDRPNKRRKINDNKKQAASINEFNLEFRDVQSLFLPSASDLSPREQRQHEHVLTSEVRVRPGLDSLFLPFQEARRLRIPEVIWIYSNPGFGECPLDIPDHEDDQEEPLPRRKERALPKAIWRNCSSRSS